MLLKTFEHILQLEEHAVSYFNKKKKLEEYFITKRGKHFKKWYNEMMDPIKMFKFLFLQCNKDVGDSFQKDDKEITLTIVRRFWFDDEECLKEERVTSYARYRSLCFMLELLDQFCIINDIPCTLQYEDEKYIKIRMNLQKISNRNEQLEHFLCQNETEWYDNNFEINNLEIVLWYINQTYESLPSKNNNIPFGYSKFHTFKKDGMSYQNLLFLNYTIDVTNDGKQNIIQYLKRKNLQTISMTDFSYTQCAIHTNKNNTSNDNFQKIEQDFETMEEEIVTTLARKYYNIKKKDVQTSIISFRFELVCDLYFQRYFVNLLSQDDMLINMLYLFCPIDTDCFQMERNILNLESNLLLSENGHTSDAKSFIDYRDRIFLNDMYEILQEMNIITKKISIYFVIKLMVTSSILTFFFFTNYYLISSMINFVITFYFFLSIFGPYGSTSTMGYFYNNILYPVISTAFPLDSIVSYEIGKNYSQEESLEMYCSCENK